MIQLHPPQRTGPKSGVLGPHDHERGGPGAAPTAGPAPAGKRPSPRRGTAQKEQPLDKADSPKGSHSAPAEAMASLGCVPQSFPPIGHRPAQSPSDLR